MTVWERSKSTFIYHIIPAVFFNVVFWLFYDVRYIFRAADVITNPTILTSELPKAILCYVILIMAIISLDRFAGVLLSMYRIGKQDEEFKEIIGSSAGIDGVQGIGKTRLMLYIAMCVQPDKWENLQYNYFIDCPIAPGLKKEHDQGHKEKYVRFLSRKESFAAYYYDGEHIPLIYSNIGITYKHKKERKLKFEHFAQKERLYESNIKIGSELDNMLPNKMSKAKNKTTPGSEEDLDATLIDEFSGLDRQYTDGTLLCDTHRNGALYLPIRDCQQVKFHLLESKHMYPGKIYQALFKLIKKRTVTKTREKTTLRMHRLAKWLEARSKYIGFTKIYYIKETGFESLKQRSEQLFFILPNEVPYVYDDRNLQKDYIPLGYRERPKLPEKPVKPEKKTKKDKETDRPGDVQKSA